MVGPYATPTSTNGLIALPTTPALYAEAVNNAVAALWNEGVNPNRVSLAYAGMQINGGCDVSQENGASAVAIGTGALYKYCIDGWQIEKNGTSQFTVQQAASVFDGFQKEIKITVTQNDTGSSNAALNHMIEGNRFAAAAWGTPAAVPVTVGFWVKSSVAGTMNVFAWNSDYTAHATSSVVISAANTRQFVTCTFPAQTGGTWDKANGLGCRLSIYLKADGYPFNVLGTIGNTFEITSLIVLPGAVAIPSSVAPLFLRSYGDELRACQRYYYKQTAVGVAAAAFFGSGYAIDNFQQLIIVHYPVRMRVVPTMAFTANTTFQYYVGGATILMTSLAQNIATTTEVGSIYTVSSSPVTANSAVWLLDAGSASASITHDARL